MTKLYRRSLKFFIFAIIIILSCMRVPEKPKWDVDLVIPISERIYRLQDLAAVQVTSLSDTLFRDTLPTDRLGFYSYNDTLMLYIAANFNSYTFFNKITSDQQSSKVFNYVLDTITVEPRECGEVLFRPIDFGLTSSSTIPVPVDFDTIRPLDSIGRGFEWIDYSSGSIFAIVHNRFPTVIRVFRLNYYDESGNYIGTSPTIPNILPMSEVTIPIQIVNPPRRVYNRMKVRITGRLDTTSNLIQETDSLFITIRTDTLKALGVRGELAMQIANADTFIHTEINDEIYSADIREGTIEVTVVNHTGAHIDSVWVMFPEITYDNRPLVKYFYNVATTLSDVINLRGYHVELPLPNVGETQKVHSIGKAFSRPTATGEFITLLSTDYIELRYSISGLKFSRFRGIPDSIEIDFDPTYTAITERLNGNLNIHLNSADLVLLPKSSVRNLPVILDLTLDASNPEGQTASYRIQDRYFSNLNSSAVFPNAHPILNLLPDSIITTGRIRLGKQFLGNMPEIRVTEDDSVYGKGLIESPMVFTINDQTLYTDPYEGVGQDRPILRGKVIVQGENRLPIGGRVHIEVTNDTTRQYSRIASADILRPPINRTTRRPSAPTTFVDTIPLPDSTIQIFKRNKFFIRQVLEIQGSGNDTLLGHGEDYLRIKSNAKFTIDTGGLE
ncbi:MAG: hypothetical protein N2450_02780 [bacterium]|nr:hypothetical protein [bacterium]